MRIELELPDWANRSNLWIMSDIEPVAYKLKDGAWEVKTERCSMCGDCCKDLKEPFPFELIKGQCVHLMKEAGNSDIYRCGLGLSRPFHCCVGTRLDTCSVRYKEI